MAGGPPLLQLPGAQRPVPPPPGQALQVLSGPPGRGQRQNRAALMDLSNFKILANMQGQSACVTLLLPNGPRTHLPNEFVPSIIHATRGLQVQELIIKHHQLKSLPKDLHTLHAISLLDISCNHLNSVPGVLCQLRELRELHLEHNHITHVTEPLGEQLRHLKVLCMQHNQLSELPAAICSRSLQVLNINSNKVQVFSDEIGKMQSLKALYATNNALDCLPVTICKLVNLEELHLSNNHIQHINDISTMVSLKQLHLAHNRLQFLPTCVATMKQLKGLTLVGNAMRFPPLSACRGGIRTMQQYMLEKIDSSVVDYGPDQGGDAYITNLYYTGSDYELETGNESPYEDI